MKFVDLAEIHITSGDGGAGKISFRRARHIPKGGPDGGDGGDGGNIIIHNNHNLNSLYQLQQKKYFKAQDGHPGNNNNQKGKAGKDLIIKVPTGTQILDKNKKLIHDCISNKESILLLQGGLGGLGNRRFKTSIDQAPKKNTLGQQGSTITLFLDMKIIADIAIIGIPNIGKSTLLSKITLARPKITEYAFSTTEPNLGVIKQSNKNITCIDIPNIQKNTKSQNHNFLKHTERCRIILHLLDATSKNIMLDFHTINTTLKKYKNGILKTKPSIICINKTDLISYNKLNKILKILEKLNKKNIIKISNYSNQGLEQLTNIILKIFK